MPNSESLFAFAWDLLSDSSRIRRCAHLSPHSYFNRDVECVRTFFSRRFKYESSVYPKFSSTIRDGVREFDLDVEVAASGFKREDRKALDDVRDFGPDPENGRSG